MSYLSLADGISGSATAVISLWFRVPTETLRKVRQEYQEWIESDDPPPRRRFLGIVPLMTFGPADLKSKKFYSVERDVGTQPPPEFWRWDETTDCTKAGWEKDKGEGGPIKASYYSFDEAGGTLAGSAHELDGSYIGVDCTGEEYAALSVNIVMPVENIAELIGAWPVAKTIEIPNPLISYSGGGKCPGAPSTHHEPATENPPWTGDLTCYDTQYSTYIQTQTDEGNADVIAGSYPETFRLLPAARARAANASIDAVDQDYSGAEITPDQWHHLILSFDFTNAVNTKGQLLVETRAGGKIMPVAPEIGNEGERTDNTCKIWISLDDENLTKERLSVYWPKGYDDDNGVLPVNGMVVAMTVNSTITETDHPAALCEGRHETFKTIQQLPTYTYTPSNIDMSNLGLPASEAHVEAIRQVEMAELQIFTGVTLNTGEETNRRAFIDADGKPVAPSKSSELLGQRPDVLLRRSSNWKNGKNTGSTGTDDDGQVIGAQFEPTAAIATYKPDPSLHGPQGQ